MKIRLVDVDGHHFPNLVLMKLSAYHKGLGDDVDWHMPAFDGRIDACYMSKVFSFTPDYPFAVNAEQVITGGSGYAISVAEDGREVCDSEKAGSIPDAVEHVMPDYSLYGCKDTAYGYLSAGCPRNCEFCHVAALQGKCSIVKADLSEWWSHEKKIKLLDPNILACRDHETLLRQLAESKALVDMTQGVDARMLTPDTVDLLNTVRMENIHFAWDQVDQSDSVLKGLRLYAARGKVTRFHRHVFVLTNFNTTHEQDLERVMELRAMEYTPFVMIYRKETAPLKTRHLQRWVNNKIIFQSTKSFAEYDPKRG